MLRTNCCNTALFTKSNETLSMTSSQAGRFPTVKGNLFSGFALIAAAILVIRIVSLWLNNSDLFFDEAQYWVWAKEPAFGYFSKPPLLAWTIAGFTAVCGDSEFCVRLVSPVFHTLTAAVIYLTATRLFDARTGFMAGTTWLLLPAVSLSSTLVSTDVPLLLCWSIALYAFIRLQQEQVWRWALVFAVAFGLGLNAKYAMAYFLLCALVYGVFVPEGRWIWRSVKFWIAILLGAALLVPNVLWNSANQFITASHTGDNIGWAGGFPHFDRLGEFLGSQFGVVGPVVFGVYLVTLIRLWRIGASPEQKMLVAFSLPVLLLISFQAIMSKAFANWAATAIPALVILVGHQFVTVVPPAWNQLSKTIHTVVFVVIAVGVAVAGPGQLPLPEQQNPFSRMWGGRELGARLTAELEEGGYTHIVSDNRKRSATLIYYLRHRPEKILALREGETPSDHFELTRALQDQSSSVLEGAVLLFPSYSGDVPAQLRRLYRTISEVGQFPRHSGSDQNVVLYRLENYHD